MAKGLENSKKLCKLTEHLMVIIQIAAILLIFVVSLYWFLDLIDNHAMSFMDPFIKSIQKMMEVQFSEELKKGKEGLDGSLFVFIMLILTGLYILSQVKIFLNYSMEALDRKIKIAKEEEEKRFNLQLKAEAHRAILEYKNIVLLVRISLKSILKDAYLAHNDMQTVSKKQEDAALVMFYNLMKAVEGCNFSKDNNTLIITAKKFESVDEILDALTNAIDKLKFDLKMKKLALKANIAIDVYTDKVLLKDVYADLKTLLKLNIPNEILCYGNFCNRYELIKKPHFEAFLKGTYDITEDENVWALVKKN